MDRASTIAPQTGQRSPKPLGAQPEKTEPVPLAHKLQANH